jgi:GAF domain-containing protein
MEPDTTGGGVALGEIPRSQNEAARLQALDGLGILDIPDERSFDAITRVAADYYDCSVFLVTFVDAHRQWFKSCWGRDAGQTGRNLSFCAYAILGSEPMIVHDTHLDDRFRDNALVTGSPFIRFYAGAPLTTSDGYNLGTLCVIDDQPRHDIGREDLDPLVDLADLIVEKLELRLQNAQTYEERKRFEGLLAASQDALVACDANGRVNYLNEAAEHVLEASRANLLGASFVELEQRMVTGDGVPLDPSDGPVTRTLAAGTALPASIFGLQVGNGGLRWLRIRVEPLLDAHGDVEGAALSLRPYRAVDGPMEPELR